MYWLSIQLVHEPSIKVSVAVGYRWPSFIAREGFQFSLPFWCWGGGGLVNLILSRRPVRLCGSQGPDAGNHRRSATSGVQRLDRCRAIHQRMCFLTQMTSLRFLLLSPLGEQQGRDDGRQRSSTLSSPSPSHYFIFLPVIPLQLPAFNPAPVFSAYKAKPGPPRLSLYFGVLTRVSPYEGCGRKTWPKWL